MSGPTFFPREIRFRLEQLEAVLGTTDDHEVSIAASTLALELRHWEREWKAGRARLVPQVEAKANGEGGL